MIERPQNIPKLENYVPTKFMAETSYYDEKKADRAVTFIQSLKHTKGKWAGKNFWLFPWQEQIIRDLFGIIDKETKKRQFRLAYIEIGKKNGKQVKLDTPIPTPTGWSTMGELKVGDQVLDEFGNPCNVVAKSDVDTEEDAYRIVFQDNSEIIAGARHQWKVDYIKGKYKYDVIMTSEEICKKWNLPSCQNDHGYRTKSPVRIHVGNAMQLDEADLPLDPYTMGIWLGDGVATKPELCVFEDDMEFIFDAIPYTPVSVRKNGEGKSWIARFDELKDVLVEYWRQKIIPSEYLRASEMQRWELLAGLIDSDGHISKYKGQAIICGAVKPLMESVRELLWTLGIKNNMTEEPSTRFGEPTGETMYIIRFVAFDDMPISKIPRYLERRVPRTKDTRNGYHYIKSMENIGNGIPMQCIQVDSPSHCYLCGPSMVPTHNSDLAAAVALYLLFGDGEASAEVYGCAADRQQASIVFDVAKDMVGYAPALQKRCKVMPTNKRIVNYALAGFYQVLSAEVGTKHGLNVSGLVFDELHAQPNRRLWDVMTKGSGDAREQPLFFVITTAGTDRNSICYEQHMKAKDIIEGRKFDKTFYPVIFGLDDDADWHDEKNWYKANPSLGLTIDIEKVRQWHQDALDNPAEENAFKQLRLNMWVSSLTRFIPEYIFELGNRPIDMESLEGRDCYGGLDLSSTDDITAFVLMFPPREDHPEDEDKYICLPFFWIPEETLPIRVRRASVPYDIWKMKGLLNTTEGNVVDYAYIEQFIDNLGNRFKIREIAFDRWGATQVSQDLTRMGFTMAMMGQGYASMSPPTKEFYKLLMEGRIIHGGNEILSWMAGNVVVEQDPAGNIKAAKNKSAEKIDGIVAAIMALDRCIRHEETASVYDDAEHGLWIF